MCIRLVTPGSTFLTPPDLSKYPKLNKVVTALTYTSDLILGAIAGLAIVGLSGIGPNDLGKLISAAIAAGVGGSGFLTNLGTKLQAEANTATIVEAFKQSAEQATEVKDQGEALQNQVGDLAAAGPANIQQSDIDELRDKANQLVGASATLPTSEEIRAP